MFYMAVAVSLLTVCGNLVDVLLFFAWKLMPFGCSKFQHSFSKKGQLKGIPGLEGHLKVMAVFI